MIATIVMTPEFAFGLTITDSYRFNLIWSEQFGELFRQGHLYPRWLPRSWDGLGSPNFYFYPPLFFWVAAAADSLTFGVLASERFVPIASLIVLAASGLAMNAWLRTHADERRSLWGSIAYMVAPYHVFDIYDRGALAEATAYASVPVIMLALAKIREHGSRHVPFLSVAYATLLVSHPPSAVLVSAFLIPAYVAFLAKQSPRPARFLACSLIGGGLGVALAAIYILPAITLLRYVSPAALSGSAYQPARHVFWHVHAGREAVRMSFIIPATVAAFLLAAAVFTLRNRQVPSEAKFWSAMTIVLAIVIAGAIPPLWRLPGLTMVQFPWRALLCVEFASITMIVICAPPIKNVLVICGLTVLAFCYSVLAMFTTFTVERTVTGQRWTAAVIREHYWDAPEYLPAGTPMALGRGVNDIRFELPKTRRPTASVGGASVRVAPAPRGALAIRVNSARPTRVALSRFYFPSWRLTDPQGRIVPIRPARRQRIITFEAPAGVSTFRLEPQSAPNEIAGRWLSAAGLFGLALVFGWNVRSSSSMRESRNAPRRALPA